MNARRGEAIALISILCLTAIVSWAFLLRPVAEHDPTSFDRLPRILNDWISIDLEMDDDVSEILGADHNLQRAYQHPLGYHVFVYIGYYDTSSGGAPEHTPDVCYPAQGWQILDSVQQRVGGEEGLVMRELLVERGGEQRLVHFWYRTKTASGITSVTGLRLSHVVGRMTENRGDGALIRVSTAIGEGGVTAARLRLFGIDRAVEASVDQVWPQPREGGSESARTLGAI
ncbi:MAG: EpsI family protein [bacterium]|nr:EpsI family protein [bacterium]